MRARIEHVGEAGPRLRLHALVYDDADLALVTVKQLRAAGYRVRDVHTPYPVHGMPEAMGLAPTRLSYATLAGGVLGVSIALGFQAWTHVVDWPLNIGGKDMLAWPALIPVTFELAVLLAAFATVGALVIRSRLRPRDDAPWQPHPGVTDDRFVIVVEEADASFAPVHFRELVAASQCEQLIEGWRIL